MRDLVADSDNLTAAFGASTMSTGAPAASTDGGTMRFDPFASLRGPSYDLPRPTPDMRSRFAQGVSERSAAAAQAAPQRGAATTSGGLDGADGERGPAVHAQVSTGSTGVPVDAPVSEEPAADAQGADTGRQGGGGQSPPADADGEGAAGQPAAQNVRAICGSAVFVNTLGCTATQLYLPRVCCTLAVCDSCTCFAGLLHILFV